MNDQARARDPGIFAPPPTSDPDVDELARLLGTPSSTAPPAAPPPTPASGLGSGPAAGGLGPYATTEPYGDLLARMTPVDTDDEEQVVDAQRQAMQAVIEERQIAEELARQARRLGMSPAAFEKLIERDPQLAAEILEEQEKAERARARVGDVAPADDAAAAVNIEDLMRLMAPAGRGADADDADAGAGAGAGGGAGFNPDAVAARARALVPVHSREVWRVMFAPPGYGGRDPRYVHEVKLVPVDRQGEYARLGFTHKPLAPLISDRDRPVECGIRTNLGHICRKRFDSVQHRLLHWQVKHPSEYQALLHAAREAEERRQREQWELEREERRLQIELQRRQLEVLERQARQLTALGGRAGADGGADGGAEAATDVGVGTGVGEGAAPDPASSPAPAPASSAPSTDEFLMAMLRSSAAAASPSPPRPRPRPRAQERGTSGRS
jgi:hypothetical protein